jgi:hypothetical protein
MENRLPCYDQSRLLLDVTKVRYLFPCEHVNLTRPAHLPDHQGVKYGASTLWHKEVQVIQQDEYNAYIDAIDGTYLLEVCQDVAKYIESSYKLAVGRVRIITLRPKVCLTYHTDPESSFRFHIPVVTNENVLFIVDDEVQRMPQCGQLYQLEVQKKHTVLNASREERIHLVFDGYAP